MNYQCFRLLTEYHSFLPDEVELCMFVYLFPSPYGVPFILTLIPQDVLDVMEMEGFRLLTEYHSFLLI